MKSIFKKIVMKLPFRKKKKIVEVEYTDLAPIDEIENGVEYLNALDWALSNKKVKNIALAGPYGSGKSSIIETYLKQRPAIKNKSLRISMATFVENVTDKEGKLQKIDIGQNEIELGILKQLFYKVDHRKIPQSRYRKLHKISWKSIWGSLIGIGAIIFLMGYIFSPQIFNTAINKIVTAGASIGISSEYSLMLFVVLLIGILLILAIIYRSILSRFKVKEIKLPIDATVKSGEESSETVFDKYLDEIVYFFEETEYRVLFFEDLDRLEDSSVFVHLRELNTLLNNYNVIKKPIVFVYAVKDNIFSYIDRTKFFEFIIPVIPVINSTNSGEILLEKLANSNELGIEHKISQNFVLDVSPYISDMRILQNIYNEFIVYKRTLREEQDLNLQDEPMMALIIFKNLYPCDFADIQMEQGIIKQAFLDKQDYLKVKQAVIRNALAESETLLLEIQSEALKSIKELKITFLCELTNWEGMPFRIIPANHSRYSASDILEDGFNLSGWGNTNQCTVNYYNWSGNGGYSSSCDRLLEIRESYFEREKRVKLIEEDLIAKEQQKVEKFKRELHDLSGWSLKQFIENCGIEEVLSGRVKENKLLVFLLRSGYIDEKYANYINYFKGNTVTKNDMNFILSIKNMEFLPFNYSLTKIPMVIQRLQVHEFEKKSIYNFDLLNCLLSSIEATEKLQVLMKQLSDEDEQSWKFIDEFVESTKHQSDFIKQLASEWPNMWEYIAKNAILTYERKIYYLALLISNLDVDVLVLMNKNNGIKHFIEQNEDILQQLSFLEDDKIIEAIEAIRVLFKNISIDNVQGRVLDYIFDNNYYELNSVMIQCIVQYKNETLVPDLSSKNYTTIMELGYTSLIERVQANLTQYVEIIISEEKPVFDKEIYILDLLERGIDNQVLCVKIIEYEVFQLANITLCCNNLITEKKAVAVKILWDALLKNKKVLPTWGNVMQYWSVYGFTQELQTFIENSVADLLCTDAQCIGEKFIRDIIRSEMTDKVFEKLLPYIKMDDFDISVDSIAESKLSIMIRNRYFKFTIARYKEIENLLPHLCMELILQNQADYVNEISNIPMSSDLLESLLFSDEIASETTQVLLDTFGTRYMTSKIAENLQGMKASINLEIFNVAWECVDEIDKRKLMLGYLKLLDADDLHTCFTELGKWYSDFIDRSKQRTVELKDTLQNRRLAEHLKAINYITSYSPKEKKEYDSVTKTEKVANFILCRIKANK